MMNSEIQNLKNKIAEQKEQLENFVPRRRVRRIYKMLGDIIKTQIQQNMLIC